VGWACKDLFGIHVAPTGRRFTLTFGGNYGSDGWTEHGSVSYSGVMVYWNTDGGRGDPTVMFAVMDPASASAADPILRNDYGEAQAYMDQQTVETRPLLSASLFVAWGFDFTAEEFAAQVLRHSRVGGYMEVEYEDSGATAYRFMPYEAPGICMWCPSGTLAPPLWVRDHSRTVASPYSRC